MPSRQEERDETQQIGRTALFVPFVLQHIECCKYKKKSDLHELFHLKVHIGSRTSAPAQVQIARPSCLSTASPSQQSESLETESESRFHDERKESKSSLKRMMAG